MLRLDPAFPPLWRSATSLQFGAEAVAVIDDPADWQQRLIRELERGIPDDALHPLAQALGAPEQAADAFLRRIRRALARPAAPSRSVCVQTPDGFAEARIEAVTAALASAGFEVSHATWFGVAGERAPSPAPVVVLAEHLVEPRRAAALIGCDVPHVPLVFTGTGAEVGPYVVPGRTACLACLAAHRRDADPAWPHLAAQLLGRPSPSTRSSLASEAAFVAAHLIDASAPALRRLRSRSVTLRADSLHRSTRVHRPHAACRCRSLGGTATADVHALPVPRTSTGFARPA
jgi:bacteriocin biosynthesis cyclodehydratase domain-containing protein